MHRFLITVFALTARPRTRPSGTLSRTVASRSVPIMSSSPSPSSEAVCWPYQITFDGGCLSKHGAANAGAGATHHTHWHHVGPHVGHLTRHLHPLTNGSLQLNVYWMTSDTKIRDGLPDASSWALKEGSAASQGFSVPVQSLASQIPCCYCQVPLHPLLPAPLHLHQCYRPCFLQGHGCWVHDLQVHGPLVLQVPYHLRAPWTLLDP